MKKTDITEAFTAHDKCAIFEVQRGAKGSIRYARLMTKAEMQPQDPRRMNYIAPRRTTSSVAIVYVQAIGDNNDEWSGAPSAYDEFTATGFADAPRRWNDTKETDTDCVPLARIKRCVNETQSFVDFFNAQVAAKKEARKRAKQAERNKEIVAAKFQDDIHDLNTRIAQLGFTDGRTVSQSHTSWANVQFVQLSLANLTELVRLAEQARMTEKVGA